MSGSHRHLRAIPKGGAKEYARTFAYFQKIHLPFPPFLPLEEALAIQACGARL